MRKNDFPKCLQCPDKEFCTMCMVRNANEDPDGDPLAVNEYFCKIAELNKKLMIEWKESSIWLFYARNRVGKDIKFSDSNSISDHTS